MRAQLLGPASQKGVKGVKEGQVENCVMMKTRASLTESRKKRKRKWCVMLPRAKGMETLEMPRPAGEDGWVILSSPRLKRTREREGKRASERRTTKGVEDLPGWRPPKSSVASALALGFAVLVLWHASVSAASLAPSPSTLGVRGAIRPVVPRSMNHVAIGDELEQPCA